MWLMGIRLVSPLKNSSLALAHATPYQRPRLMLALSRSAFAIKEASAVRRFRQPLPSKYSGWSGSGY
jgi:hypothetical protein